MGKLKDVLVGLQNKVDSYFYVCEYIKDCDKVSPQCREGGNSYCGEFKRRSREK